MIGGKGRAEEEEALVAIVLATWHHHNIITMGSKGRQSK